MTTKIQYNDLSDEIKSFLSGSNGRGGTFYVDDYIASGETDNWQSIQNAINDAEAAAELAVSSLESVSDVLAFTW